MEDKDIAALKKTVRKQILSLRDSLSENERKRGDVLVTEKILGHQWYYGAEYLLLFASYGSEIDTFLILEDSLIKGKKVYFPKIVGKEMHFYRINSPQDLKEGFKGILEPSGNTECFIPEFRDPKLSDIENKTLMIMPGVAFDRNRRRIGYGGGFYDRYLSDKPWIHTIAIGYKCQMLEEIPTDETDIRPGQIICF